MDNTSYSVELDAALGRDYVYMLPAFAFIINLPGVSIMSDFMPNLLSRFWSSSSAGGLVCGRGIENRYRLSHTELLGEFGGKHRYKHNTLPTALMSTTDKITRTLSGTGFQLPTLIPLFGRIARLPFRLKAS